MTLGEIFFYFFLLKKIAFQGFTILVTYLSLSKPLLSLYVYLCLWCL